MGRSPCCDKSRVKRGSWSQEEDAILKSYLAKHGPTRNWISLPHKAGLRRCGKSCRLRWLNYLRPNIKHGGFTQEEEDTICNLYNTIGSRWSAIAAQLEGRTDNEVKNFWHTKLKKKFMLKRKPEEEEAPTATTDATTTTTLETLPKLVTEGSSDFSSANSNCPFSPPLQEFSSFSPFGFEMDGTHGDNWISSDEGFWDYSDADVFSIF